MDKRQGALLGGIILLLAVLSGLHANVFGVPLNFDINIASVIVAVAAMTLAVWLRLPQRKLLALAVILVIPIGLALAFSWAELLSEFDPRVASKGWGYLWLISMYIVAAVAFVVCIALKWIVLRVRG